MVTRPAGLIRIALYLLIRGTWHVGSELVENGVKVGEVARGTNSLILLWGDRVRVLRRDPQSNRVRVFARGTTGWLPESALGGEPLLELHIIDVGQGDGVLVVTPEGHHHD